MFRGGNWLLVGGGIKIRWKGNLLRGIFLGEEGRWANFWLVGGTPPIPSIRETLTIKNGQISLYFRFNKIIKGPWTSFQSPALSQKHVMFFIQYTSIWPNFVWQYLGFKRNKHDCNFHYVAMPMIVLWISQKHKNLDILRAKHYFFFK